MGKLRDEKVIMLDSTCMYVYIYRARASAEFQFLDSRLEEQVQQKVVDIKGF